MRFSRSREMFAEALRSPEVDEARAFLRENPMTRSNALDALRLLRVSLRAYFGPTDECWTLVSETILVHRLRSDLSMEYAFCVGEVPGGWERVSES